MIPVLNTLYLAVRVADPCPVGFPVLRRPRSPSQNSHRGLSGPHHCFKNLRIRESPTLCGLVTTGDCIRRVGLWVPRTWIQQTCKCRTTYVSRCIHTYTYTCTCMHAYLHTRMYFFLHTHTNAYTCMYQTTLEQSCREGVSCSQSWS